MCREKSPCRASTPTRPGRRADSTLPAPLGQDLLLGDALHGEPAHGLGQPLADLGQHVGAVEVGHGLHDRLAHAQLLAALILGRSEEHTSELQSLITISYAV